MIATAIERAQRENAAEMASFTTDLADIDQEIAGLERELASFKQQQSAGGKSRKVTYGTQEVDVATAISLVERDLGALRAAKQKLEGRRTLIAEESGPYTAALANVRGR